MSDLLLPRDRKALAGVHPDLVRVVEIARASTPFIVVEGLRTLDRQRQLVAQGRSQTLNSRHITGHAVDLAPWLDRDRDRVVDADEIPWASFATFRTMADVVLAAARQAGVPLEWGGNWPSFRDGPHFQLPFAAYPAPKP